MSGDGLHEYRLKQDAEWQESSVRHILRLMEEPKPKETEQFMPDFYRAEKFTVTFNKIRTPEYSFPRPWYKRLVFILLRRVRWKRLRRLRDWASGLRHYRCDLRQVIMDNTLKDMYAEDDGRFVKVVDSPPPRE